MVEASKIAKNILAAEKHLYPGYPQVAGRRVVRTLEVPAMDVVALAKYVVSLEAKLADSALEATPPAPKVTEDDCCMRCGTLKAKRWVTGVMLADDGTPHMVSMCGECHKP